MKILKKILLVSLSIFCLVGCDYTSKKIAKEELKGQSVHSFFGGNLKLVYSENSEGMLNIGSQLSQNLKLVIFKICVALLLSILFVFIVIKKGISKWSIIALVFILSGGIGNLIDRILNGGKVVDFIIIGISNFHTGIFNIADLYVTMGVILFIISEMIIKKDSSRIAI